LTGNLPPGLEDGTALGAARLLFTASLNWRDVWKMLGVHYGPAVNAASDALAGMGDSLSLEHRGSVERLAAVLALVDRRWPRLPVSLTASSYYPGDARELAAQRVAGPLDRAILAAGLAKAAHLQVALFLARADGEPFLPDFPLPQQFDRLALRLEIPEEGRAILVDPSVGELEAAEDAAAACSRFLGCVPPWEGLYELDSAGALVRISIE
jgi:hypothetical protein